MGSVCEKQLVSTSLCQPWGKLHLNPAVFSTTNLVKLAPIFADGLISGLDLCVKACHYGLGGRCQWEAAACSLSRFKAYFPPSGEPSNPSLKYHDALHTFEGVFSVT